jgi:GAF domain-containing protein
MLKKFQAYFKPQEPGDREAQATFRVLHTVLLISLLGAIGTLVSTFTFTTTLYAKTIIIAMNVFLLAGFILLRRHILSPARVIAPLSLFITITFLLITGSGIHDISLIAYGGVIILASLTLGRRAAFVFAGLIVTAVFSVGLAEISGLLVTDASFLATLDDPFVVSIVILAITSIQVILINRLNLSIQEARDNEKAQTDANLELTELKSELEKRVADRTAELGNANTLSQKRARQFEAIARVSSAIASAQNLQELLPRIAEVIGEQFNFHHVGVFLNDAGNQFAVLGAANSPGGKKMLERGFQIKIGEEGIVGYVTGTGIPRIAFDVGQDAVSFNNPDLPSTRSEMALPLRVGGKIIGALDVQSTEPSALGNEDITSLSILADQVSIAIENARLYETTRKSLEQTESTYRQYVQNEWTHFAREENLSGFQYVDGNSAPLQVPLDLGEVAHFVHSGNIHQSDAGADGKPARLAVPVKLREEVIGVLHISTLEKSRWADDDVDIAVAVADHLALAIENARLFQASANRAARERIVSDISSKISGNIHVKDILQTAAQELSQALQGSDVLIQIQSSKQPAEVRE